MLKTKKGYILRKVGKEYMIVTIGNASKEFNGMIQTNETGAFYWKELEKGITKEDLLSKMLQRFPNLDKATAKQDLNEFFETISFALEEV